MRIFYRILRQFWGLFRSYPPEQKDLSRSIRQIIGRAPINLNLYYLALSHTSASKAIPNTGVRESNERLEYLGDALLGAIVAEYLFKKYPYENEGFLTDIRSRIVNRETLNQIGRKLGLDELIIFEGKKHRMSYKSMNGDALEALVGAVYLDRGFDFCVRFVIKKILQAHVDLEDVVNTNKNFKSMIIEWAQKENKELKFEIVRETGSKHRREFIAQIYVNEEAVAKGSGFSKKKAEQASAEKACEKLGLLGNGKEG